jgi:hypothetical protein
MLGVHACSADVISSRALFCSAVLSGQGDNLCQLHVIDEQFLLLTVLASLQVDIIYFSNTWSMEIHQQASEQQPQPTQEQQQQQQDVSPEGGSAVEERPGPQFVSPQAWVYDRCFR